MSRRLWFLAVTGWVVVVAAGSALTWVAIDRAGRQVTGDASAGETPQVVVGTTGVAPTTGVGRSPHPSASASPSAPSGTPTVRSAPTPGTRRSSTPRPSAPPARTETRTWAGAPGTVTVSCSGRTVRLRGASPNDGWSVERGDDSGDDIEVSFRRNETEVKVRATCVAGTPRFAVESDASSGGDD